MFPVALVRWKESCGKNIHEVLNLVCQKEILQAGEESTMLWGMFSWNHWGTRFIYKRLWLDNSMCVCFLTRYISICAAFMLMNWIFSIKIMLSIQASGSLSVWNFTTSKGLQVIEHIWDAMQCAIEQRNLRFCNMLEFWIALPKVWAALPTAYIQKRAEVVP